jgi:hypothetical protein
MTEDGWDAHRAQYLAGRLEGLAGTTRYDLTDEDRETLKEAATMLQIAVSR